MPCTRCGGKLQKHKNSVVRYCKICGPTWWPSYIAALKCILTTVQKAFARCPQLGVAVFYIFLDDIFWLMIQIEEAQHE